MEWSSSSYVQVNIFFLENIKIDALSFSSSFQKRLDKIYLFYFHILIN